MDSIQRRGFLGRLVGAASAFGVSLATPLAASAQTPAAETWLAEVKGRHRRVFDFSKHMNGVGLLRSNRRRPPASPATANEVGDGSDEMMEDYMKRLMRTAAAAWLMLVQGPDGVAIGAIRLPENCANVCLGGLKRNRLFMTASQSLYAVYVDTQGAS